MTCVIDGQAKKSVSPPHATEGLAGIDTNFFRVPLQVRMNYMWLDKIRHYRNSVDDLRAVTQEIPIDHPAPENNVDVLELRTLHEHRLEVWNADLDLLKICSADLPSLCFRLEFQSW